MSRSPAREPDAAGQGATPPSRAGGTSPAARIERRIRSLPPRELRQLSDRLDATLREADGSFFNGKGGRIRNKAWHCDLLPHVFTPDEWKQIEEGFRQRLRAFEMFLDDVYGNKEILRQQVVPVGSVLGSPAFLRELAGIPTPGGRYLHLCGIRLTRDIEGRLVVKSHHFSRAVGIAYMMQNRRILARVAPDYFDEADIATIAETPLRILERLNALADGYKADLPPVLLSDGPGSPVFSDHLFLARRMGLLIVQAQDLVALEDGVYLKTLRGLRKVGVIYNRIRDALLDPLVFDSSSPHGIPGLVHCVRKGTVAIINGLGCQLVDDRALLPFADSIIRFYLGERAILPSLETRSLADVDLREMVLEHPERYKIRPVLGERILASARPRDRISGRERKALQREIAARPEAFVAQPMLDGEEASAVRRRSLVPVRIDHMVFALRTGKQFRVFPGALTRTSEPGGWLIGPEHGGGTKDSWVTLGTGGAATPTQPAARKMRRKVKAARHLEDDTPPPQRRVTNRICEAFYWMGRYLERAYRVTMILEAVQALEAEELNQEERKLFHPVWTRLLPKLESGGKQRRKAIRTQRDRYALLVDRQDAYSVASAVERALSNATGILDRLSGQAWNLLEDIRDATFRHPLRDPISDSVASRRGQQLRDVLLHRIPEFFTVTEDTMLADDGLRFARVGRFLERANISANALVTVDAALDHAPEELATENETEIQLSVFLRLLGSRDAYRRVYQMRARLGNVLELLWQNPEAPQSVMFSLRRILTILSSPSLDGVFGLAEVRDAIGAVADHLEATPFARLARQDKEPRLAALRGFHRDIEGIHETIHDYFLTYHAQLEQRHARGS